MTAPSTDDRRLVAMLEDIARRLIAVEEGLKATQLDRTSIDDGLIEFRAADGTTLETYGVQPGGGVGTQSFNRVPPPVPSAADVTPFVTGLDLAWGGQLVGSMPPDFRAVRFYCSPVKDFVPDESNYVGSLSRAGSIPVAPLPYVEHWVKLVAVNMAGAESLPSLQTSGTPAKVVADAVLDGIVTETSLAASAVTEAKLAVRAVTGTKVADNAISTPKLVAGAVQAEKLAVDSVQAGKIAADAVTAREVKALSLTGNEIAANSINAGHVTAGAITSKHLETDLALTSRLIAGDPTGTRVELSESGLLVVKGDEVTFSVDSSTGDVVSMGQYYTSRFGERIAMNVAGLQEPTIRAYPRRGNRYADLRSLTYTRDGTDYASWEFRLPLLSPSNASGVVDLMVYDRNFVGQQSSRMRWRGFFNSSGVVHPGWSADGQNVAIVFFNGCLFVVNAANTARADLNCDNLAARSINGPVSGGQFPADFYGRLHGEVGTPNEGWTMYGVVRAASRRELKTAIRPLDRSPLAAVADLEWPVWRYREPVGEQTGPAEDDYVGPMVDDMTEHPVWAHAVRHDTDGRPVAYDQSTVVGILGAALAEQHAINLELRQRLAELEGAA